MQNNLDKFSRNFPSGFYKNTAGEVKKTRPDAAELAELIIVTWSNRIRFNILTLKIELDGEPIANSIVENFYIFLAAHGYTVKKLTAQDSLLWAAQLNTYHPVIEDLDRIYNDSAIQPDDINKIASNYLATTEPIFDDMLKATLIGAVARVYDRGCKFDNLCVLKGRQGVGKSSFWRFLATDQFFNDTWQTDPKDLFLAIQKCWIYELSELDHMTSKHDAAYLKALLSSKSDEFRRPYERASDSHPRPSIFVGSVNRSDFLVDVTGSRRFWVLDLPNKMIDLPKLKANRDNIWKSAILAYKNGEQPILSEKSQKQSEFNNLMFESEHQFMSAFYEWLNNPMREDSWQETVEGKVKTISRWIKYDISAGFTTREILINSRCRSESNIKPADFRQAAECLRQLSYIQAKDPKKRDLDIDQGKRVRLWVKKTNKPD